MSQQASMTAVSSLRNAWRRLKAALLLIFIVPLLALLDKDKDK